MNQISHTPKLPIEPVVEELRSLDLRDWEYVCTTSLYESTDEYDVYYHDGDYLAVYLNEEKELATFHCTNAEEILFACVQGDDQNFHYSSTLEDTKYFSNGNMIEGGRFHIRCNGEVDFFHIREGQFHYLF